MKPQKICTYVYIQNLEFTGILKISSWSQSDKYQWRKVVTRKNGGTPNFPGTIDNKLKDYTETVENNLLEISVLQKTSFEAPESNYEGKKILYVDNKGNPIDSKDVRLAVGGSVILKDKPVLMHKEQYPSPYKDKCFYGQNAIKFSAEDTAKKKLAPRI